MKIEVNLEKKFVYAFLGIFGIIAGALVVNAVVDESMPWHSADSVKMSSGDSLQEAFDGVIAQGAGGGCYVHYGSQTCAAGYTAVVQGKAYSAAAPSDSGSFAVGPNADFGGGFQCVDDAIQYTGTVTFSATFMPMKYSTVGGAFPDLRCAVCCK